MKLSRLYNPFMRWLLRSPLHGLISNSTMLVTYAGRKSGKSYTVPVGYVRDGDVFLTTSLRDRTWWRNLHHGAPVTLRVKGQDLKGAGEAIADDDQSVAQSFVQYLRIAPQNAKYFDVDLDADGHPLPSDVARAVQSRVVVRFQVTG